MKCGRGSWRNGGRNSAVTTTCGMARRIISNQTRIIADWDYSLGPPPFQRKPTTQPDTRTKLRHDMAPLRLVVSSEPIGSGILCRITLACGHSCLRIAGKEKRRRCQECMNRSEE